MKHSTQSLTPWARPTDVHCVERVRFPQPVARRSPLPRVVFGLACALGGACFVIALEGVVAVLAFNFN